MGIVVKGSAHLLWLLLRPAISMAPAIPTCLSFPPVRAPVSALCVRPPTDITRQMLIPPVEGRDARDGRPEAAGTPWVTDLGDWSLEMPNKPLVSPLAGPDLPA